MMISLFYPYPRIGQFRKMAAVLRKTADGHLYWYKKMAIGGYVAMDGQSRLSKTSGRAVVAEICKSMH
jgi:hypothetical protein